MVSLDGNPFPAPLPGSADTRPPDEIHDRGPAAPTETTVHSGLRVAAAYAWRLIVVAVAVYLVFAVLAKLTLVAVAVFVGLVIAALLRPLVDRLARPLPRGLAVATALLLTLLALGGVFTFVANSVAGQSAKLTTQFTHGLTEIQQSLTGAPFHLRAVDLTQLGQQLREWVTQNGGSLAGQALGGAGVAIEVLTGFVLAVFCSVFFLASGDRIWTWLLTQTGAGSHRWDSAARAGWATFAGYTRGIVIIAATNAILVCVALLILRVPLALPLALLTFFAAFIPLIGSPIALFVATLVALAARGPLIALVVLGLIVVIGQIEGHLLHPMVMSRAVNLHPLAVALAVASGTILAGVIGAVVAVPLIAVTWTVWTALRTDPPRNAEGAGTSMDGPGSDPDPGSTASAPTAPMPEGPV
ncbi:MAG TPA: AI-2E family transporter [Dermatophilaceae bacterium]